MKELGIYVHVPFCKSKCKYCNFNSYTGKDNLSKKYFDCLCGEIKSFSDISKEYNVTTVYIGGGTPSFVDATYIDKVMECIRETFNLSENVEISIEANPNSVTEEKAKSWLNSGVNRVSVGLQSATKKLLDIIGRTHSVLDYKKAMKTLRSVGFTNLSTDIMLGLPRQRLIDVKSSLNLAQKYSNHISAYALILEEKTPLFDMIKNNQLLLPAEEKAIEMYDIAYDRLRKHGFFRYEVSNFAQIGYESKHNFNCWSYKEYIGFGAGAHSFIENSRHENVANIEDYISKMTKEGNAILEKENLSREEQIEEFIMLGLRKEEGISLQELKDKFNYDLLKEKDTQIKILKNAGFIKVNSRLSATEMGFFVLNRIIMELS